MRMTRIRRRMRLMSSACRVWPGVHSMMEVVMTVASDYADEKSDPIGDGA